jgi:transcriptional regulator with XRE-family HTH domain
MRSREQLSAARRIGMCIRTARRASALSRNQVARSAGLTGREIARYEHGKVIPCRRDVQALAGACGIDTRDLLPADLMEQLLEVPGSESAPPTISNDEPESDEHSQPG